MYITICINTSLLHVLFMPCPVTDLTTVISSIGLEPKLQLWTIDGINSGK